MKSSLNHKTIIIVICFCICMIIAFFTGEMIERRHNQFSTKDYHAILRLGQNKLVNHLLACEDATAPLNLQASARMKKILQHTIANEVELKRVKNVSIYYRDLTDGTTMEINGDETFEPASLNKIPLMIAYLKLAQDNPEILHKTLTYNGKVDATTWQYFKPQKTLEPGKAYTIDELIHFMIAYSDNNAWLLLLDNIDEKKFVSVYKDLNVKHKVGPTGEWLVTVDLYSEFLRVLYSASYLNDKMSEKALEYMSERKFPSGISSGIPPEITICDKFGEMGRPEPNGLVKQLHDISIVYYPDHPYLLGIMTKGDDSTQLALVLQDISKQVFDEHVAKTKLHY